MHPLWLVLAEECNPECLDLLRPHLSTYLRIADILDNVSREGLLAFVRCLNQLHQRAVKAEVSARHWESEWSQNFQLVLHERQRADAITTGSDVERGELQHALAGVRATCNRMTVELRCRDQQTHMDASLTVAREQAHAFHLCKAEEAIAAGSKQQHALMQKLAHKQAEMQELCSQIEKVEQYAARKRSESEQLEERVRNAERYALAARNLMMQHAGTALQQREEVEALREQGARMSEMVTRAAVMQALSALTGLWRIAASPAMDQSRRRLMEQLAHELVKSDNNLLQPTCELVQEPLRHVLGDAAAMSLGLTLVQTIGPTTALGTLPAVASTTCTAADTSVPTKDAGWAQHTRGQLTALRCHSIHA